MGKGSANSGVVDKVEAGGGGGQGRAAIQALCGKEGGRGRGRRKVREGREKRKERGSCSTHLHIHRDTETQTHMKLDREKETNQGLQPGGVVNFCTQHQARRINSKSLETERSSKNTA